jgi:hypothetical protein
MHRIDTDNAEKSLTAAAAFQALGAASGVRQ